MRMEKFIAGGKEASLYHAKAAGSPLIVLNHYTGDGKAVVEAVNHCAGNGKSVMETVENPESKGSGVPDPAIGKNKRNGRPKTAVRFNVI